MPGAGASGVAQTIRLVESNTKLDRGGSMRRTEGTAALSSVPISRDDFTSLAAPLTAPPSRPPPTHCRPRAAARRSGSRQRPAVGGGGKAAVGRGSRPERPTIKQPQTSALGGSPAQSRARCSSQTARLQQARGVETVEGTVGAGHCGSPVKAPPAAESYASSLVPFTHTTTTHTAQCARQWGAPR